jgi:hypothetical protein
MWRLRHFVKYLAYHLGWLSGISALSLVMVVLFTFKKNDCDSDIAILFLSRGYDCISLLLRLTDLAFASRILLNVKGVFKNRKQPTAKHLVRTRSRETDIFISRNYGGLGKLGDQDVTGVFQSLSVKVMPRQFILDSLITLTLFQCHKIADAARHSEEAQLVGSSSNNELVYFLEANTLKKLIPFSEFGDLLKKCKA